MNDRSAVLRLVSVLAGDEIPTWVFGGWAEELRGVASPRPHRDIDLLYRGSDFRPVDELIERRHLPTIPAKRLGHKRALVLNDVVVELFLVRSDYNVTPHTIFWDRLRYDWPRDVFGFVDQVPVASAAALQRYRADYRRIREAAPARRSIASIYRAAPLG